MSDQNLESGLGEAEGLELEAFENETLEEQREEEREEFAEIAEVEMDLEMDRLEVEFYKRTHKADDSVSPTYEPPSQNLIASVFTFFQTLFRTGSPVSECPYDEFVSGFDVDELALFQPLQEEGSRIKRLFPEWSSILYDENHAIWEYRCKELIPPSVLYSLLMKRVEGYRGKLRAYLGAWNPSKEHCSPNIFLLEDRLTVHRIPAVNQTDAVRGQLGFNIGIHAWDYKIQGPLGSHFSLGVATREAALLSKEGYVSLVGDNEHSWGWDLVYGTCSTRGVNIANYPERTIYDFRPGDIIRMILDCGSHDLSFEVNGVGFGKAFINLPRKILYPSVSMVYGNTKVALIYVGDPASIQLPI